MQPQADTPRHPEPAERERQLYAASRAIHSSVDLQSILDNAAKEIALLLGARKVTIRIDPARLNQTDKPENHQP